MPPRKPRTYRRRKKSYVRRKRYTRKFKNTRNAMTTRGPQAGPFPRNFFTRLIYSDHFNLTTIIGGGAVYQTYAGNGMHDPDITGTGHQPRYYDTLVGSTDGVGPYNKYCVYASKITCYIWAGGTTGGTYPHSAIAVLRPTISNSVSGIDGADDLLELPFVKIRNLTQAASSKMPTKISHYYKTKTVQGMKDVSDSQSSHATAGANPNNVWYWQCLIAPINPSDYGGTFYVQARIKYYCKLYSVNIVASS